MHGSLSYSFRTLFSEASLLKAENLPPHQTSLSSIPALLFFSVILFTISHTLCFTCLLSIRPHTLDYKLHESKIFVYFVPGYSPSAYSAWHRAGTEIFILGINTSGTPISKHNLYQKIKEADYTEITSPLISSWQKPF